jgi:hypothetical protein
MLDTVATARLTARSRIGAGSLKNTVIPSHENWSSVPSYRADERAERALVASSDLRRRTYGHDYWAQRNQWRRAILIPQQSRPGCIAIIIYPKRVQCFDLSQFIRNSLARRSEKWMNQATASAGQATKSSSMTA